MGGRQWGRQGEGTPLQRGCSREGAPTVQLEKSRFLINNFVIKRFLHDIL